MRALRSLRSVAREHVGTAMLGFQLMAHPVWRNADPDEGAGLGVLLVPGFGAADASLSFTSTWLASRGYRPAGARIGFNLGCTSELVDRIERRLEEHTDATGGPVALIGHSRGGGLARLAAARRPDLVCGLVMLGSPVVNPTAANPRVMLAARALAKLTAAGIPGLMDQECFSGACYADSTRALATPLPSTVPAVSMYSRTDAVVPWRLSLDPSAECVQVNSTHIGMGLAPDVYTALRPRLAAWATRQAPALRRSGRRDENSHRRIAARPEC
ncbi:alpha/beta hydrolase [Lentzea tibetensis]|uniref:Alpha/beta hydrolase n=1 Tax=Lentzea tibetensis TaxID=2591470 RepID=A0A563F108_9PSEU|nr:alpha/beta fold hydrolase [Lentzea tibetensis]TWP53640.1 alpha/beta hydrolase [Lentzea tibetensis]